MAIEYNFTLDMDRSKRDNNIAYARTGDVDSITINADLVLNSTAYTPTGTNAFFECVTPNGHSVRAAAEKSGSSVSVEVPSAAFQAAGVINVAYFRFESGDADNPTYVESTEPFAIVVREGIGDNIDAGDYIEEWRALADYLDTVVADVEQKAEQAETAINEQKTEVDQLKVQAQTAIAGDVTDVEEAAQSAITAINQEKADVADAAEDVSAAGEQAINTFNTNSQQAINQFNTNADAKLDEVDGMITEAQGDVDAAITQLEDETQNAIQAAQDALDGTTATNLQNAVNRTLKLDVADMTNIPDNSSLSSFTNVGSYCCKTAVTAATIGDCPVDDSPFNLYVFSSATSGQVMQLVVPIDLQGKPTAEWHVRFGTSSAMDPWSVIGGGADIAAGLGIDVTGDAQKTVSLDTTAFYQHHEAAGIIQGSTEVTGGGRIKQLKVYGNTRQNLWQNPSGTKNGVTVASNSDSSITLSGTTDAQNSVICSKDFYILKPSTQYTLSVDKLSNGIGFAVKCNDYGSQWKVGVDSKQVTFTTPATISNCGVFVNIDSSTPVGTTVSGTYRVMLNEGSEADPWCPPGLNGIDELSVVTAGRNLLNTKDLTESTTAGVTFTPQDDGGIKIKGTAAGSNADYYIVGTNWSNFTANYLPHEQMVLSINDENINLQVNARNNPDEISVKASTTTEVIIDADSELLDKATIIFYLSVKSGKTVNTVVYPQLELGSVATEFDKSPALITPIDISGHTLNSLPDGTCDELTVDASGKVTLVQRVGEVTIPTDASDVEWQTPRNRISFDMTGGAAPGVMTDDAVMCDVVPPASLGSWDNGTSTYALPVTVDCCIRVNGSTSADDTVSKVGGGTVLYPLATPVTIELPDVTLSELASPDYTVYVSSNVPAELEAEVVKVDYLPPSDVYTKEEVDQKIEDAGGMPDIVPVSQGGTGVTTAAAERNRLGLGNTTGALPVANGGTGSTTAKAAQNALLNDMNVSSDTLSDSSMIIGYNDSPSASNGAIHKRSVTTVWDYIATKVRSVFGFDSSNVLPVSHGGTGSTTAQEAREAIGAGTSDFSGSYNDLEDKPSIPEVPVSIGNGGTGGSSASEARTNLDVYSKSEVEAKVPKVVYGTGNMPDDAEPGTIYINYSV